jgi:hypothetical protein
MPFPTPTETALEATKRLIRTLNNPMPSSPFAHQPFNGNEAIQTIADTFQTYSTPGKPAHVIPPEPPRPPTLQPLVANQPTASPPRVATTRPQRTSPRVSIAPIEQAPRYPKRHIIPMDHSMNLVSTMLRKNNDINVDLAFQPRITTDTHHWACSIIDPDT